jgi:hypothetical protein
MCSYITLTTCKKCINIAEIADSLRKTTLVLQSHAGELRDKSMSENGRRPLGGLRAKLIGEALQARFAFGPSR